jgi:hypothetical protein
VIDLTDDSEDDVRTEKRHKEEQFNEQAHFGNFGGAIIFVTLWLETSYGHAKGMRDIISSSLGRWIGKITVVAKRGIPQREQEDSEIHPQAPDQRRGEATRWHIACSTHSLRFKHSNAVAVAKLVAPYLQWPSRAAMLLIKPNEYAHGKVKDSRACSILQLHADTARSVKGNGKEEAKDKPGSCCRRR